MNIVDRRSILLNSETMQNSLKNDSSQKKLVDYLLLLLIFIFFAVPLTGLSLHYYKFGMPPRLMGLLSFFWTLLKGLFDLI